MILALVRCLDKCYLIVKPVVSLIESCVIFHSTSNNTLIDPQRLIQYTRTLSQISKLNGGEICRHISKFCDSTC